MMPVSSPHSDPIAYLVRVGSHENGFPLISDPSLNKAGIEQVEAVREFFYASGIGQVKAIMTAAGMEFANLLTVGFMPSRDLPPVIVCDSEMMRMVSPGGIIAVYEDDKGYRYEAVMGEIPPAEQN